MKQSQQEIQARQERLLNHLKLHHSIRVPEASRLLQVSELTVRRDLEALEKKNLLHRFHGGATINQAVTEHEPPLEEKQIQHESTKLKIARQAASLIPEGSTVFLNSGSTTLNTMKYLDNRKVRIITNNSLAPSVITSENIDLIITGGECRSRAKSLVGEHALLAINAVYADYCILGVNGISAAGTTTSVYQETAINEAMVRRCNGTVIIVADGSKIGKSKNFMSVPIQDIDILITDTSADKAALDQLAATGIRIILIDD